MRFFIKWAFIRWLLMLAGLLWFILSLSHPQMAAGAKPLWAVMPPSQIWDSNGDNQAWVNDGNLATFWTGGPAANEWILYQYGSSVTAESMCIVNHTVDFDQIKVTATDDDTNWDTLLDISGVTGWVTDEYKCFNFTATGSYYKYFINFFGGGATVKEIRLHDAPVSSETATLSATLPPTPAVTATPTVESFYWLGSPVECEMQEIGIPGEAGWRFTTEYCQVTFGTQGAGTIAHVINDAQQTTCGPMAGTHTVHQISAHWDMWIISYFDQDHLGWMQALLRSLNGGSEPQYFREHSMTSAEPHVPAGTYSEIWGMNWWGEDGGTCTFRIWPVYDNAIATPQATATSLANTCWEPGIGTPAPDWDNVPPEYAVCLEMCTAQGATPTPPWAVPTLGCLELDITPFVPPCYDEASCATATANPPTALSTMDLPGCYTPTVALTSTPGGIPIDPICFLPPGEREDDPIVLDFGQVIVTDGACYTLVPGIDITIPAFLGLWEEITWSTYEWQFCIDWVTIPDLSIAGIGYTNQLIIGTAVLVILSLFFKL